MLNEALCMLLHVCCEKTILGSLLCSRLGSTALRFIFAKQSVKP